jgi:MOSC domain-containing protein YiiM
MKIVSLAVSKTKGVPKKPVNEVLVIEGHGIKGDAHAGDWHRQISFLAIESIENAKEKGLDVGFGDFAENIATEGIEWKRIPVGTRLILGDGVLVEVTQIGKECHTRCAIFYKAGDCIMPKEGIFGRVLKGGILHPGDGIRILSDSNTADPL